MERTERFYYIHNRLNSGKCLPMQAFLDALEVSRATFQRDIEYLRDRYGAPVVYDRDSGGYRYEASDGHGRRFELPGLWFNADEVHALLSMHALVEQMAGGFMQEQLASLRDRIAGLMGRDVDSFERLKSRIRVFPAGQRRARTDAFGTVAQAVIGRWRLAMRYGARTTGRSTEREVSPQRLIHYRGNWYLDAWCHTRDGPRAFSLDAIESARITEEAAVDIDVEDLERTLGSAYGIFTGKRSQWAVLRFNQNASRWIADEVWHADQKLSIDSTGCATLEVPYALEQELVMDVLRHGTNVEVLKPDALRARVVKEICSMAALYGEAGAGRCGADSLNGHDPAFNR